MTYAVSHSVEDDALHVVLSGSVDDGSVGNLANDVIALGERMPMARVLVDVRALEDRVSTFNVLHLIHRYPAASKRRRIAVLERPEQARAHEFHETAAVNRGFRVRHFTDADRALSWLGQDAARASASSGP